jgi:VanZ family protein
VIDDKVMPKMTARKAVQATDGMPQSVRFWRWAFGVCALAVLVLALLPRVTPMVTTGWDKGNHMLAFGTLAILGLCGFPRRAGVVLTGLLAYGGLIEILQSFTPNRVAEWLDLVADAIGLLLGWGLVRAFDGVSRRKSTGKRT